jgi:hypothetical protein
MSIGEFVIKINAAIRAFEKALPNYQVLINTKNIIEKKNGT